MLDYSVQRLAAGVHENLSLRGIETVGMGLEDVFKGVMVPFDGLSTVYMQEKFYSERLYCKLLTTNNLPLRHTVALT